MIEKWIHFATVVDASGVSWFFVLSFFETNIFLYIKSIDTWNNNDQQHKNISRKKECIWERIERLKHNKNIKELYFFVVNSTTIGRSNK